LERNSGLARPLSIPPSGIPPACSSTSTLSAAPRWPGPRAIPRSAGRTARPASTAPPPPRRRPAHRQGHGSL